MSSYTVLTVFENVNAINEPVISMPMMGRVSFRQIGIIITLSVMVPLLIYSSGSEYILDVFPHPVFSFTAVNAQVQITWDVILAIIPIPVGLLLGMPRPKLVPMDQLIILLAKFAIYHTSVNTASKKNVSKDGTPSGNTGKNQNSLFAGFAGADPDITPPRKSRTKNVYLVAVTDIGIPKNITVTIYDTDGTPMRNRLARVYINDDLLSSITTDSDGTIGITFVPRQEGTKHLIIRVDGTAAPVVDAVLDVRKH